MLNNNLTYGLETARKEIASHLQAYPLAGRHARGTVERLLLHASVASNDRIPYSTLVTAKGLLKIDHQSNRK